MRVGDGPDRAGQGGVRPAAGPSGRPDRGPTTRRSSGCGWHLSSASRCSGPCSPTQPGGRWSQGCRPVTAGSARWRSVLTSSSHLARMRHHGCGATGRALVQARHVPAGRYRRGMTGLPGQRQGVLAGRSKLAGRRPARSPARRTRAAATVATTPRSTPVLDRAATSRWSQVPRCRQVTRHRCCAVETRLFRDFGNLVRGWEGFSAPASQSARRPWRHRGSPGTAPRQALVAGGVEAFAVQPRPSLGRRGRRPARQHAQRQQRHVDAAAVTHHVG